MAKNYRIFLFDNGIKTQARVIGYDTQYDGEDDVYYPIIEFKDEKGISITTKLERGATHKMYANYKEIAILYDPTDPQDLIVLD